MKTSYKKKWVSALRSGKYKQGQGMLHPSKDTFCCLGVLCDLVKKEVKMEWKSTSYLPFGFFEVVEKSSEQFPLMTGTCLPAAVQEIVGLDSCNPELGAQFISDLNDIHEKSFVEIADLIEKHL